MDVLGFDIEFSGNKYTIVFKVDDAVVDDMRDIISANSEREYFDIVEQITAEFKGSLSSVNYFKEDKRSYGPLGEPAVICFDEDGEVVAVEQHEDGKFLGELTGDALNEVKDFLFASPELLEEEVAELDFNRMVYSDDLGDHFARAAQAIGIFGLKDSQAVLDEMRYVRAEDDERLEHKDVFAKLDEAAGSSVSERIKHASYFKLG